jgi:nucleoside-diphosphate kinase
MAMEATLVLVKPDGVQRGLIGEVISRFERKGLVIAGLKLMRVTPELAETHYGEHKAKPFYPSLVSFITSGPVVAMAVRGPRAIKVVRDLMGKTFGHEAAPGTIRGDFSASTAMNIVHGSDSPASARRELGIFFPPAEILEYDHVRASWCYNDEDLA